MSYPTSFDRAIAPEDFRSAMRNQVYVGGAAQPNASTMGNSPGGGGGFRAADDAIGGCGQAMLVRKE